MIFTISRSHPKARCDHPRTPPRNQSMAVEKSYSWFFLILESCVPIPPRYLCRSNQKTTVICGPTMRCSSALAFLRFHRKVARLIIDERNCIFPASSCPPVSGKKSSRMVLNGMKNPKCSSRLCSFVSNHREHADYFENAQPLSRNGIAHGRTPPGNILRVHLAAPARHTAPPLVVVFVVDPGVPPATGWSATLVMLNRRHSRKPARWWLV